MKRDNHDRSTFCFKRAVKISDVSEIVLSKQTKNLFINNLMSNLLVHLIQHLLFNQFILTNLVKK